MARTRFPHLFQRLLVEHELTQADLLRRMSSHNYPLDKRLLSMMANGDRNIPPLQITRICDTLQVDSMTRLSLHRAAALDYGYDLDCNIPMSQTRSNHASIV